MSEAASATPLILASSSPRRRELLGLLNIPFEVIPSRFDEPSPETHPDPAAWACELAREKALEVAGRYPGRTVLGADTLVVLCDRVLGKPRDAEHAVRMLAELSGVTHAVITGVALVTGAEAEVWQMAVRTQVTFRALAEAEVRAYVSTGEPMDKAGGYAIQGHGAVLIERMDGDYPNVVGLPLTPLALQLRRLGYSILGMAGPR